MEKEQIINMNTVFRVKGWQLIALEQYGNTLCRAHWPVDEIVEAFAKRGMTVELYRRPYQFTSGYKSYIIVNAQHRNYAVIIGGLEHV